MEPENDGFQEELPFSGDFFSGSMLNFWGCIYLLGKETTYLIEPDKNLILCTRVNIRQSEYVSLLHGHSPQLRLTFEQWNRARFL